MVILFIAFLIKYHVNKRLWGTKENRVEALLQGASCLTDACAQCFSRDLSCVEGGKLMMAEFISH